MMTNCVPKILVVDSEPNWTAQVETILERQGRYQVEVTTRWRSQHGTGIFTV